MAAETSQDHDEQALLEARACSGLPIGALRELLRRERDIDYTGLRLWRVLFDDGTLDYLQSRDVPNIQPRITKTSGDELLTVPTVVTGRAPVGWSLRVDRVRMVTEVTSIEQVVPSDILDDVEAEGEGEDGGPAGPRQDPPED